MEMAASDVVEYCQMDEPSRPISTASSVSATRPLDEIALLKKGCLTSNYERRNLGPITQEELARRDLQTKKTSSTVNNSSHYSLLTNPVIDSTTYRVGLPEERTTLKIGTTTRGERYELYMDEVCHAVLDIDPEIETLVTFRN